MSRPDIALQARPLDLGRVGQAFARGQEAAERKEERRQLGETRDLQKQALQEKIIQQRFQNIDTREQARLRSTITAASRLNTFLDNNDVEGARKFLNERRSVLQDRIAAGENVDTVDTDEALQLLETDPEALKQTLQSPIQFGQQLGILQKPDTGAFTLGEGETRFTKTGEVIAKGTPKAFTLKPGEVRTDATGKVIARGPEPGLVLTKGEEAVDKNFAKELVDFEAGGGFSDAEKQIDQLKLVEQDLQKAIDEGNNLTGPSIGIQPNRIQAFTNPQALETKERVEEVVQRNLRLILGAQFTEKEGERLIARAFNQSLEEKENKRRVTALVKQMEKALKAKKSAADFFKKNGTLKGWKGETFDITDFEDAVGGEGDVIDFSQLQD